MSNTLRGHTLTIYPAAVDLVTQTCCNCGVLFAMTAEYDEYARQHPDKWWYCPNGHKQHYPAGKTDGQKLKDAEAREVALRDQLEASVRDAERARQALLRDRQRFANGVCPCCNRSFENVRRHMKAKHPEFPADVLAKPIRFECGCGRKFDTYHGLRVHQSRQRPKDWAKPGQSRWQSHLTVGATR